MSHLSPQLSALPASKVISIYLFCFTFKLDISYHQLCDVNCFKKNAFLYHRYFFNLIWYNKIESMYNLKHFEALCSIFDGM